jgi:hypothetical protein
MVVTVNDARTIAEHIVRNAQPEQIKAICYYSAVIAARQEPGIVITRNFILALIASVPRTYDQMVHGMNDGDRTRFDDAIAHAVRKLYGERQ